MGYTVDFIDNEEVTEAQLEELTTLLGATLADFTTGTPYGPSNLNSIRQNLINKGVLEADGLKCTISGANVHIAAGHAFFTNGLMMTVDSSGIDVPFTSGTEQFIYLAYNKLYAVAACGATLPSETASVFIIPLAKVTALGEIVDTRLRATYKMSQNLPAFKETFSAAHGVSTLNVSPNFSIVLIDIDVEDYGSIFKFNGYWDRLTGFIYGGSYKKPQGLPATQQHYNGGGSSFADYYIQYNGTHLVFTTPLNYNTGTRTLTVI